MRMFYGEKYAFCTWTHDLQQKNNLQLSREICLQYAGQHDTNWTPDSHKKKTHHSSARDILHYAVLQTFALDTDLQKHIFSHSHAREICFYTMRHVLLLCKKKHFYWIVFHGSMTSTPIKEMIAKDKRKYFSAKPTCGFYLPKTTSKHSMIHTQAKIKIKMPTCRHAAV